MSLNKRKFISWTRDIKGAGKISKLLARCILPKPKGSTTITTIHGFQIIVDPVLDNGVEKTLYYYGTYEKGTLAIIGKILNEGDVFVDVGANIGLMSLYASQAVGEKGKVYSFEPNPNTKKILDENIALNKLKNIKVAPVALSSESKKSKIYDRWDVNRGGASLIKPEHSTDSYDIDEITFSEFFRDENHIKLIKVDVEGYELEVLKGAKSYLLSASTAPMMIVEFSSGRENTFGKDTLPLYQYILDLGIYRIFKSSGNKERISKLVEVTKESDLPSHDNIYCFTNEHLKSLPEDLIRM